MRKTLIGATAVAIVATGFLAPGASSAAEMEPIVINIVLGKEGDKKHRFYPDKVTFKSGQLYTLVLTNPTNNVHEIDSPGFLAAVLSKEVVVFDDIDAGAKPVANVVGTPIEIEVFPGGKAEWTFIAVEAGDYEVICDTKEQDGKTHQETGMKGVFTIN